MHTRLRRRQAIVAAITCLTSAAIASGATAREVVRSVLLVPHGVDADRATMRFLTAVPAATVKNGAPLVIAVTPGDTWRPELVDFLKRYQPSEIWAVGDVDAPGASVDAQNVPGAWRVVRAGSAELTACAVAREFFGAAARVVMCTFNDRAAALEAAVLAGRLGVPLLPCTSQGVSNDVRETLVNLRTTEVMIVGGDVPAVLEGFKAVQLATAADVARFLEENGEKISYIAAVNAEDGQVAHARDVSLAAAILAVGRDGAIAPTPDGAQWKTRFEAKEELKEAPAGVQASTQGWRAGDVHEGGITRRFVTGLDPASGRVFMQVDLNGDGDFEDAGEGPLRTAAEIGLGGRSYSVSLDADENARMKAVWLTWPAAGEITASIRAVRTATRERASMLCLVGWPQTLPMAVVGEAMGLDADLVSDYPLAQTDEDPFVDLAYARFIAEDAASATLQASRGLAAEDFVDRSYAGYFATAEWMNPSQPLHESLGFRNRGHHAGGDVIGQDSPLANAGWIMHASHSMWTELGETYKWDSRVLLAPALVQSDGCSTAALDMDSEHRSAPARMLRNGALAYVGAARRNSAPGELYASEVTNAILAGRSVGEAHRDAMNRMMVATMSREPGEAWIYRYQLSIASAYGDPALVFTPPASSEKHEMLLAARMEVEGSRASVLAGGAWHRTDYAPLEEWKCRTPRVYTWRGLGVGAESIWSPGDNRNADELVYTAEVRTDRPVERVWAADDDQNRWGFDGRSYIDVHEDGTRSIYWRVRLIDFDMNTGDVRAHRARAEFRLE